MPLWTIYHSPGVFEADEKRELAARIADHYERAGLPRFYVMTVFSETRPEDMYVGGEQADAGVRVVIDHIARHSADEVERRRIAYWIKDILEPYLGKHAGVHWEFHADETSEDLWMINDLIPPPMGSDAEKRWVAENAVSVY